MPPKPEKDDSIKNTNPKHESIRKLKRFTGFFKKKESKSESVDEIEVPIESTREIFEPQIKDKSQDRVIKSLLRPETEYETKSGPTMRFEDFVDERILLSRDIFGKKEMKIKILDVSDEHPPSHWKLGDRVKVNKILVTIKHLESLEIEEGEFDIEAIEKELAEKRHYTSTNRWVPTNDVKNGYVIGARHTSLISDAIALEYISF
jgi:hypothetical protein